MNCQENNNEKHSRFFLNTSGISLVEFFWGLGLPLVVESSFLQVFLHSLGAPSVVLGIVPTLFFLGQASCGIFSAYLTSYISDKKRSVIVSHLIPPIFLMIYGFFLLLTGFNKASIPVFLIFYSLFSLAIGLVVPVWQNFLLDLFSHEKTIPAISVMMLFQTAGKLIGSFLIAGMTARLSITNISSGLVFIICGFVFSGASFFFLITKSIESVNIHQSKRPVFHEYFRSTITEIRSNRNFLYFLGSEIEFYSVITAISFYAAYGLKHAGLSPAFAAGGLIAANIAGQLAANTFLGIKNILKLKQKAWFSRFLSLTGLLCLAVFSSLPGIISASFLLGGSRAIRNLIFTPAVKHLSGKKDATGFFAIAPLITLPAAGGIPLLSGHFLDLTAESGIWSYRMLFLILWLIVLISCLFLRKTRLY